MLGLGWSEMLVIAVVVLIVVGPKDLPVMLRNLGRMMGSVRRMSNEFRREIDKAIAADEIKEAKKAISDPLRQTTADITKEFNSIRDGKVEPSGKIKPGTEGQESVYEEIRAQAGMTGDKAAAPSAASASIRAKIAEQQAQAKETVSSGEQPPASVKAAAKPRSAAATKTTSSKTAAAKPASAKTATGKAKTTTAATKSKAAGKSGAAPAKAKSAKAPKSVSGSDPVADKAVAAPRPQASKKTRSKPATKPEPSSPEAKS